MKYKYIALTKDSKKVEGVIEAVTEVFARNELHKMGLSVLDINLNKKLEQNNSIKHDDKIVKRNDNKDIILTSEKETTNNQTEDNNIFSFYFKGIDPSGKEIDGIIDSHDRYSAYERLQNEYKFNIIEIYLENLPEIEKKNIKKEGINDLKLELATNEENKDKSHSFFNLFLSSKKTKNKRINNEKVINEQSKNLQDKIEKLLHMAETILKKYQNKLPGEFLDQIKANIDRLSIIRMSNNFLHIKKLSDELIAMINPQDPTHPLYNYQNDIEEISNKITIKNKLEEKQLEENINKDFSEKTNKQFKKTTKSITTLTNKLEQLFKKTNQIESTSRVARNIETNNSKKEYYIKLATLMGEKNKIKKEFWYLTKLLITKHTDTDKNKVRNEWNKARQKYKKISKEIKKLKKEQKPDFEFLLKEIKLFITWLLVFYLTYFFIAKTLTEKNTGLQIDFFWKSISSPFLLYTVITLFIFEAVFITKIKFFKKNFWAGFGLITLGTIISTTIIINY